MNELIVPGAGILLMKVGTHAREELDNIITRKQEEHRDAGMIFWGYGGNTCHPTHLVQPFAAEFERAGRTVHLLMTRINSRHFADPALASEYSDDGIAWKKIPDGIQVRGSRYALVLGALQRNEFDLDLRCARVAIGPSRGRPGDEYLIGHVDKGCFVMEENAPAQGNNTMTRVNLYAPLKPPYAVFLR
jgi:hypothetical protein